VLRRADPAITVIAYIDRKGLPLEYTVHVEDNWHTEIHVTVKDETIQSQLEEKCRSYQKRAKIEGFRAGKVPRSLIHKMFGQSIEREVFGPYCNSALKKVFKENELVPITSPKLEDIKFDKTAGLTFKIVFDQRPRFEVAGYEGMPVEKIVYTVGEDQVDAALENLRDQNAMIYTVDGEAQKGHLVVVDVQEVDRTGVPILGTKEENQTLQLSNDANDPLTQQLLGVKAWQVRNVHFVDQIERSNFKIDNREQVRREAIYRMTVKEIKERKLPDLDDDFAKDVGDYETLSELKEDLKEKLTRRAESEAASLFRRALADELIKRIDFKVPPSIVERYVNAVIEEYKSKSKGKSDMEKELREYYKSIAIRNIKWQLIKEDFINKQEIKVSENEIENKQKELAESKQKAATTRPLDQDDEELKEKIEDMLLEEKVYAILAKNAQITEVKKPYGEIAEEATEEL
jgi:trigger factor